MPITFGANVPWLENWPMRRQLWAAPGTFDPESELDLSVELDRELTVTIREEDSQEVVYQITEPDPQLQILQPAQRGVIQFRITGTDWNAIRRDRQHSVEISAYGYLYDEFPLVLDLPEPRTENINGITLYASPREVLEVLGPIVGPDMEVTVPLLGDWSLNAQGYWERDIDANLEIHGLWANDYHVAGPVEYATLSMAPQQAFARVDLGNGTHRLYVKTDLNLGSTTKPIYVETAHNVYVWRCILEASAQVERRSQRSFGLNRIYREAYDGRHRQRQLITRAAPVIIDEFFRLDAYAFTRNLFRRYTEADFLAQNAIFTGGRVLHAQKETGIITVNQNFWDWWDAGTILAGDYGLGLIAFMPKGQNNIEVTYTAGYTVPPADIAEACANYAAIRQMVFWKQAITQGLSGIGLGCVNLNFNSLFSEWLPSTQQAADQICDNYQRVLMDIF